MPQNAPPSVPSTPTPFRCTTTGMSIVPLEPLAQRLEAWLTLPSLSRWLTRTIRLGYAIQFARQPPKFNGILETSVAVRNSPVLREEIAVLLAKDAIEPVPPAERRQGFYSPYFIVPEKRGGLRPILDLRVLNRALHKLPFKMRTRRRIIKCIQPQDWFAAIELKDAYFHVSILLRHRPFLRFAFEGRAWQYRVLPFRALPVSRVFTKVVEGALTPLREVDVRILNYLDDWLILAQSREQLGDPRDLVLRHLQPVGASGQLGKKQALPCAENLYSRCGVRLGEYDGMPHGGTCPSSAELPEFLQRQECGTTETVSEAPGAYGIRSCSHTARIASYETTSALATLPGPEVGMAPRYTASGYHPAVSPLPQPLDGPCLSTGRGAPRTSVGKHDLIVRFLKGARRMNPSRPPHVPSWDLSIVLAGLQRGPFEPLDSVELKFLSLKTALLTALTSIKRVRDLQAFSVSEECLVFGPVYSHVVLRLRPGYVPKVPTTPFRDQVVNLQALPSKEADPALALLCPVRALRIYVDRTRSVRSSKQLFVCHGGQQKGKAVSKQRLAHWIVEAVGLGVPVARRAVPPGGEGSLH